MAPNTIDGFAAHVMRARTVLLQELGLPVPSLEQLKWGCTCGACLGGWISPTLRAKLMTVCVRASEALIQVVMTMEKDRENAGGPMVTADIRSYDGYDDRLPGAVEFISGPFRAKNLSQAFLRGSAILFTCTENILRAGHIPYPPTLKELAEMHTAPGLAMALSYYQDQGGSSEHVLNAALTMAGEMGADMTQTKEELAAGVSPKM